MSVVLQSDEPITLANIDSASAIDLRKFLNRYQIGSSDWRRKVKDCDRKVIVRARLMGEDHETLVAESEARMLAGGNGHGGNGNLAIAIADAIRDHLELDAPELDVAQVVRLIDQKLGDFGETLKEQIEQIAARAVKTTVIDIPSLERNVNVGVTHRRFEQLLRVISLRLNAYLVGPAGWGKTTAAEKASTALGLGFYPQSVGPQTTQSELKGFIDATGTYRATQFRKAFENGGVFLIDEIDRGNAGVITFLNAALANGYCSFPDATVQKHADFVCIAAANTYGTGADRQYVGANQLDAATLDRFVFIEWDEDADLEAALMGVQGPARTSAKLDLAEGGTMSGEEWLGYIHRIRKVVSDLKLRMLVTPRASQNGIKLFSAGFGRQQVEEMVVWKGIDKSTRDRVCASM